MMCRGLGCGHGRPCGPALNQNDENQHGHEQQDSSLVYTNPSHETMKHDKPSFRSAVSQIQLGHIFQFFPEVNDSKLILKPGAQCPLALAMEPRQYRPFGTLKT
jgi:hypothetical protein